MTSVNLRECTVRDIDAVLKLNHEWEEEDVAHVFVPLSRDEYIASLTQFPAYFLVAECENQIVGFVNATEKAGTPETVIPAQERYVMIENLYVASGFRHDGIGGELLERVFRAGKEHGIERFMVSSDSKEMDKILEFYQGHGFALWHVQLYI